MKHLGIVLKINPRLMMKAIPPIFKVAYIQILTSCRMYISYHHICQYELHFRSIDIKQDSILLFSLFVLVYLWKEQIGQGMHIYNIKFSTKVPFLDNIFYCVQQNWRDNWHLCHLHGGIIFIFMNTCAYHCCIFIHKLWR